MTADTFSGHGHIKVKVTTDQPWPKYDPAIHEDSMASEHLPEYVKKALTESGKVPHWDKMVCGIFHKGHPHTELYPNVIDMWELWSPDSIITVAFSPDEVADRVAESVSKRERARHRADHIFYYGYDPTRD